MKKITIFLLLTMIIQTSTMPVLSSNDGQVTNPLDWSILI